MRREHRRRFAIGAALFALLLLPGPVTSAAPPLADKADKVSGTAPDSGAELAAAGHAIETGDYQGAVATLSRVIDSGSLDKENLALAYHHRGIARQKLGLQGDALDDYSKAIDLGTLPAAVAARAHYNRAISLAAAGDAVAAERDYTRAIELAPDYAAAYHNRANLERERKDYPTAIRDYGAAIERLGEDRRKLPLFGRALAYEKSGDLAAAVADLNRALALDPSYEAAKAKLKELEPQLGSASEPPAAASTGGVIKVASAGGWDTTAVRAGNPEAPAPQKTVLLEQGEKAPAASSSSGGPYRMQLGAFRKPETAIKAWEEMERRDAGLAQLDRHIETADLGEKGTYYRLQAGGFKTASEAKARCADLAAREIVCVVVMR